jgi:hypothetical protein
VECRPRCFENLLGSSCHKAANQLVAEALLYVRESKWQIETGIFPYAEDSESTVNDKIRGIEILSVFSCNRLFVKFTKNLNSGKHN